ncbi:hypothetical protein FNV43_RR15291 [Rhamnella rubrinervis]|uniref:Uncharacterized protein n=1 Tax=Rhamnella rubrinervis TaxID=2594499 RepID=A0A8K0E1B0_9ROSA|nr:hypothetical protein FNV43_RR15291 [Rhamnella rubrinervis]
MKLSLSTNHLAAFIMAYFIVEIEKMKLSELTCRQGVIEVAKIIYGIHDEAKDKDFELEMSWVCDESNRLHQKVPDELLEETKVAAKAALEEMNAD